MAMAAVFRVGMPGVRNARSSARSSEGAAACVLRAETSTRAIAARAITSDTTVTGECVPDGADGGVPSAVDGYRDGPPAPLLGPGGRREPEVDDPSLDGISDVGCQARPVARDVQLGAERDQFGIDGDHALADRDTDRGAPREVVRDGVDLHPVGLGGPRLTEGGAAGDEHRSGEDRGD